MSSTQQVARFRREASQLFLLTNWILIGALISVAYSADEPNYRLPQNVVPMEYNLSIQTYIPSINGPVYPSSKNFTFDGHVTITIRCLETTASITMQMHQILLHDYKLFNANGENIVLTHNDYDNVTQKVNFYLSNGSLLVPGSSYLLSINYTGFLNDGLAGFYRSSYEENGTIKWLAITDLEPTDARKVLPCFDEPSFKASFNVTIIHPSNMIAISNELENPVLNLPGGWSKTSFVTTPKMSTYLLAICVADFQMRQTELQYGTLFRVWARPSLIDDSWYALEGGSQLLTYYSDFFKIPYPLSKLDLVAVPDLSSAMENWGMITYQESDILVNNKTYGCNNIQNTATLLAHEIAHQWFGDLVTLAWWDDLWLNEGFAQFMQYQGADYISNDQFQMVYQFVPLEVDVSMILDQVATSRPIYDPHLVTPDQINGAFDAISYDKGAAIINQLQFAVGSDIFAKGLTYYLTSHEYNNANHQDLWNSIQQAINEENWPLGWDDNLLNVTEFMNPWILQMGFPVINVIRYYNKNEALLSQLRFVLPHNSTIVDNRTTDYNYTWYVPVCYDQTTTSICNLIWVQPNQNTTVTNLSKDWLLINAGAYGLYRTNYDVQNWQLLLKQLQTNFSVIDARNRAQLIDDSLNLARAGLLTYDMSLNLTTYLVHEFNYIPWLSASYGFMFFQNMFATTAYEEYFGKYLKFLMQPVYDKIGWRNDINLQLINRELRQYIVTSMCLIGDSNCTVQALMYYRDNLTSVCSLSIPGTASCSKVNPSLRKPVYCTGVSEGGANQFDYLFKKYPEEQVAVEKDNILYGLCCSNSIWALKKLLNEAISPNSSFIRQQDAQTVFQYIGSNQIGQIILWDYFVENFDEISQLFSSGVFSLSTIIESVCQSFNKQSQVEQMKQFLHDKGKELGSGLGTFVEQLQAAQSNVVWMDTYAKEVVQWIINLFG